MNFRTFIKPIRMSDNLHMKPGYIFTDTDNFTVLEVAGMTNLESYSQHVIEKIEYYKSKGIVQIWWMPLIEEKMPDLPPISKQ